MRAPRTLRAAPSPAEHEIAPAGARVPAAGQSRRGRARGLLRGEQAVLRGSAEAEAAPPQARLPAVDAVCEQVRQQRHRLSGSARYPHGDARLLKARLALTQAVDRA